MIGIGKNISLRKKIIGIIIFSIILTVSVSFIIHTIITIQNFKSDLSEKITLNSEIVSQYLIAPLDFEHKKGAEEIINKLTVIPSVKFIAVLDKDDSLFAYYGKNPGIKLNPVNKIDIKYKDDFLYLKRPIKFEEKTLGNLLIVSSIKELNKNINEYIITSFISFALILLIGFYTATKLQDYITKPIFSLSNLAKEIRVSGNYYLRARKENEDEVGTLAEEFNKLLNRVQQQDKARDKYEEILTENQIRLKRAQVIAKIGSWNYDPATKEFVCSEELNNIFEFSKKESNRSRDEIISLIDRKDIEQIKNMIEIDRFNSKNYEFKIKTDSGKEKYILGAGDNLLASQIMEKQSGIFQDITEKKMAERELTFSKKRFENIFESAPVSLIEVDKKSLVEYIEKSEMKLNQPYKKIIDTKAIDSILSKLNVISLNQNAVDLFEGETKNQIIEKFYTMIHPRSKISFVDMMLKIILNHKQISGAVKFKTVKENQIYSIVKIIKIVDQKQDETILLSITDITEIENLNKDRELLLTEVKRKNAELEQIIYVASHDLRSPLVNIQGFGKELDINLGEIRETLKINDIKKLREEISQIINDEFPTSLKFIRTSAMKMDYLLDGLLRLSRLGRAELTINKLDMNILFKSILETVQYQIIENKIEIKIERLHNCKGDNVQLNQLFTNIIDNAIKYSRKDIKSKIKISSNKLNDSTIYCIEDNGIGIDKKHLHKVFEIFHRLNPDKEVNGEGLGLSIVKRILQRHNGKVWIESEINAGTKVFVELPS